MTNNETTLHKNVGSGFLWIFWLVAVGAWAIQLFVSYALVEWHCARPQAFSEATLQWTLGLLTLTCLAVTLINLCLLYTSPSPRDRTRSRMPSSA